MISFGLDDATDAAEADDSAAPCAKAGKSSLKPKLPSNQNRQTPTGRWPRKVKTAEERLAEVEQEAKELAEAKAKHQAELTARMGRRNAKGAGRAMIGQLR